MCVREGQSHDPCRFIATSLPNSQCNPGNWLVVPGATSAGSNDRRSSLELLLSHLGCNGLRGCQICKLGQRVEGYAGEGGGRNCGI